jgi:glycosyltransferase involved in cell wall biosynthesis
MDAAVHACGWAAGTDGWEATSMMRATAGALPVIMFTPELNGSGAQQVLVNIANGLVMRGHHVEVVTLSGQGVLRPELDARVTVVDLSCGYTRAIPRLMHYLRSCQPTQILAFYNAFTLLPLVANWLTGGVHRVIPTMHTMATNVIRQSPNLPLRVAYLVMLLVWRSVPQIIAVSHTVAQDLTQYGIRENRISVLYNPVLDAAFYRHLSQTPTKSDWPESFGEQPVIIGVGRLCHQKNFEALIRAYSVMRHHVTATLLLVGDGERRHRLQQLVRRLDIASSVVFAGYVQNPVPLMARSRVLVLSSHYEGMGNVAIEAMAAGTPVIAYDHLPVREMPVEDGWLRLIKTGDEHGLAAALQEAVTTPKPRVTRDVQTALSSFEIDTALNQYTALLGLSAVRSDPHRGYRES